MKPNHMNTKCCFGQRSNYIKHDVLFYFKIIYFIGIKSGEMKQFWQHMFSDKSINHEGQTQLNKQAYRLSVMQQLFFRINH